MKNRLQVLVLAMVMLLPAVAVAVPAQTSAINVFSDCTGAAATTAVCKAVPNPGKPGTNPAIHIIKVAITIVSIIIGVAAVIMIILAGLAMVTSNGDPQAIAKARTSIIYALIGLIVAALAETIVAFVLNKL